MTIEPQRIAVDPSRLDRDKGDIAGAYSADTICYSNKIRKPFTWQGHPYITVGVLHGGRGKGVVECESYRLVPKEHFTGAATKYGTRACGPDLGEEARNDPNGFYHGMLVKGGTQEYVIVGPELVFVAGHIPAAGADTATTGALHMIDELLSLLLPSPRPLTQEQVSDFYKSVDWAELRYRAIRRYGRRCMACGRKDCGVIVVDHIKPVRTHPHVRLKFSNLQMLCGLCNRGKGSRDRTDWRTRDQRRSARTSPPTERNQP